MEISSQEGFVSPETHSNVKKQLMDLRQRHKQFGAIFAQLEESEKLKELQEDKIQILDEIKKSILELDTESNEFLNQ